MAIERVSINFVVRISSQSGTAQLTFAVLSQIMIKGSLSHSDKSCEIPLTEAVDVSCRSGKSMTPATSHRNKAGHGSRKLQAQPAPALTPWHRGLLPQWDVFALHRFMSNSCIGAPASIIFRTEDAVLCRSRTLASASVTSPGCSSAFAKSISSSHSFSSSGS